jgi:cytoskeleton protein RodZ
MEINKQVGETSADSPQPRAASAGAWLRQVRQERGLHIAALAVMLKVPQAKLESLEGDRWSELPDATFARTLATAMCRALKVDPAPVLAMLPANREHLLDMSNGLNQPFRERGGRDDSDVLAIIARPIVWGPALLLVAAALVYWLPAGWLPTAAPPATAASAPASAENTAPEAPAPVANTAELAGSTTTSSPLPAEPVPAPAPMASAPLAAYAEPVAAPAAPSASVVTPVVAAAGAQALRLKATADAWVEVIDARGQVLFSKLLRPGEAPELIAAAPIKLRLGNAPATRIEWRGAPVDLGAQANSRVARVELN